MTDLARELSTGPVQRKPEVAAGSRRYYIDNIRWLMIILVVVIHACVTYSGLGSWYYKEPSAVGLVGMLIFAFYESFTQAFFMGLLFFIAGIFVPKSYERKGAGRFVRDRLFRLGVPSLVFMLVIGPLTTSILAAFRGDALTWQTAAASYRDYVLSLRFLGESGPLWFAVALLVFSVLYAVVRSAVESFPAVKRRIGRPAGEGAPITHATVVAVILTIGVGSFLVRVVQPVGASWMNMQFCYFTQYIVLFLAGLWVGNGNRLEKLSTQFGVAWLKLSIGAGVPAWFLIGALGGAVSGSMDSFVASVAGGWHWQAAAMAMWESFFCVSFVVGLLVIYRERANTRNALTGFLSANAFGVYVFHTPILVSVSLAMHSVAIPAIAKTGVVMTIAVIASFVFAWLVRRVPGLKTAFS